MGKNFHCEYFALKTYFYNSQYKLIFINNKINLYKIYLKINKILKEEGIYIDTEKFLKSYIVSNLDLKLLYNNVILKRQIFNFFHRREMKV